MIFRFAQVFGVLMLFASVLAANAFAQGGITLTWEVLRYDISATLPDNFQAQRDLQAVADLSIRNVSQSAFSRLTLRISDQAKVSSVSVNGATADFSSSQESTGGSRPLQRIIVRLPSVAPTQTVAVTVRYSLNVKENSGLAALSATGSQFLPMSFWYPTPTSWFFTGGADFAPLKMTVAAGSGSKVFSAGAADGNTYDLKINGQPFFVSGPYEMSKIEGVELVHVPRGTADIATGRLESLAALAAKANSYISGRLGRTPIGPLRLIFVKRGAGFSDSGTILLDDSSLVREKIDSQTAAYIIEGIAKSYLGNEIRVEGDGFGVIREGLSRFLANQFIENEFGAAVAAVERLQQRTNYTAISRRDAPLNVVSPVDGYYYTATANKGSVIWSYLAESFGDDFFQAIRDRSADGKLNLGELRSAFSSEKTYLDYTIDRVTEMNLMVGLPQSSGGRTKAALRNLGELDARVLVTATTVSGKKLQSTVVVRGRNFGEAVFETDEDVIRIEIDEKKTYPQTDYSDDIAPRVIDETDALLFIKKEFDRQRFQEAAKNAETVLALYPEYHDARVLLARSLLADGKFIEAQRQFRAVLESPLPSPQSIAWSQLGLGIVAQKAGRIPEAESSFRKAIAADAEYGATLGAVRELIAVGGGGQPGEEIRTFFSAFDRAAVSNSKAAVDELLAGGEVSRFAVSVAGQAQQWATEIKFVQEIDSVEVLVAANVTVKLLNREIESGVALFRLSRIGGGLKLSAVDIFEVG